MVDHVDVAVHAAGLPRHVHHPPRWNTATRPMLTNSHGGEQRIDWAVARRLVAAGLTVACDECSTVFSQRVFHTIERGADLGQLCASMASPTERTSDA